MTAASHIDFVGKVLLGTWGSVAGVGSGLGEHDQCPISWARVYSRKLASNRSLFGLSGSRIMRFESLPPAQVRKLIVQ